MVSPFAAGYAVLNLLQRYLIGGAAAVCIAIAIESQPHHQLIGRHPCLQMFLNGLMRHQPSISHRASTIERRMVVGRTGHVVGHDIDEIEISYE